MFDAGTLLARIQVQLDGAQATVNAARQVSEGLKSIEGAASPAAASLDLMDASIMATAERLKTLTTNLLGSAQAMNQLGGREAGRAAASRAGQEQIKALRAEAEALQVIRLSGQQLTAAQQARIPVLRAEYDQLVNRSKIYKQLIADERAWISTSRQLQAEQDRLARAMKPPPQPSNAPDAGGRALNRTGITSLMSALMSGNVTASLLAQGLFRIGAAAGPIAALVAVVFKLGTALAQATSMAVRQSHLPELSSQLQQVADDAGIAEQALRGIANTQANLLRASGVDAGGLDQITRLAEELRFLTTSRDLVNAQSTLAQGITTGNVGGIAREFGFNEQRMKNEIGDTSLLSDGERAAKVWEAVTAEAIRNSQLIKKAQSEAMEGWAQAGAELQGIWDKAGRVLAPIMDTLARGAESGLEALGPLVDLWVKWVNSPIPAAFMGVIGVLTNLNALIDATGSGAKEAGDKVLQAAERQDLAYQEVQDRLAAVAEQQRRYNEAISEMQRTSQAGFGMVDAAIAAGRAMADLNEEFNPANALAYFRSLEGMLNTALSGNVGPTLEMMRERAMSQTGITEEARASILKDIELVETAFAPAVRKARELQTEAGRFQDVAGTGMDTLTSSSSAALTMVDNVTAGIERVRAAASTPINLVFSVIGGFGPGGGGGGAFTATGSGGGFDTVGQTGNTAKPPPAPFTPSTSGADYLSSLNARGQAVADAEQIAANEALAALNARHPGGGGGGAAGGPDVMATIEQIRALIAAVQEAIMIGITGSRIDMSGNAIPSIDNSFISSAGTQLAVQQLIIKGVWDFTDPAAKREVIRELEEMLAELQGESV